MLVCDVTSAAGLPIAGTLEMARRPAPELQIRNHLLGALPAHDLELLRPRLEPVTLHKRQILQERNVPVLHAYFIEDGAASLLSRSSEKQTIEVCMVGRKGFVGVPVALGTMRSPHRCIVQLPGRALRISATDLRKAMAQSAALQRILLGYVQAVFVQSSQLIVCNTRHSLGERLARWLLVVHDRLDGDSLPLTHDLLGRALGVRRASITVGLGRLEASGLIQCRRGEVTILDRRGLEGSACECHRVVKAEHERVLRCFAG